MGFGERLQREREMRGITLEEIANATKIGSRSLRALEQEEFDKLPGGIFNKGFVRAYCRYLGINEEQAVADYLAASGEQEKKDLLSPENLQKLEENWKSTQRSHGADIRVPWAGIAVLVAMAAVLGASWHYGQQGIVYYRQAKTLRRLKAAPDPGPPAREAPVPPAVVTAPIPPPAPEPAPVASPAPVAGPVPEMAKAGNAVHGLRAVTKPEAAEQKPASEENGDEFVVLIRARRDSWVSVVADGKRVMEGTLFASRQTSVHAREKVTLKAGNAAAVEVSFNGEPQPALGGEKEVRTVTFTSQGLQR